MKVCFRLMLVLLMVGSSVSLTFAADKAREVEAVS